MHIKPKLKNLLFQWKPVFCHTAEREICHGRWWQNVDTAPCYVFVMTGSKIKINYRRFQLSSIDLVPEVNPTIKQTDLRIVLLLSRYLLRVEIKMDGKEYGRWDIAARQYLYFEHCTEFYQWRLWRSRLIKAHPVPAGQCMLFLLVSAFLIWSEKQSIWDDI